MGINLAEIGLAIKSTMPKEELQPMRFGFVYEKAEEQNAPCGCVTFQEVEIWSDGKRTPPSQRFVLHKCRLAPKNPLFQD